MVWPLFLTLSLPFASDAAATIVKTSRTGWRESLSQESPALPCLMAAIDYYKSSVSYQQRGALNTPTAKKTTIHHSIMDALMDNGSNVSMCGQQGRPSEDQAQEQPMPEICRNN